MLRFWGKTRNLFQSSADRRFYLTELAVHLFYVFVTTRCRLPSTSTMPLCLLTSYASQAPFSHCTGGFVLTSVPDIHAMGLQGAQTTAWRNGYVYLRFGLRHFHKSPPCIFSRSFQSRQRALKGYSLNRTIPAAMRHGFGGASISRTSDYGVSFF